MRVGVTGANGFIGRFLVESLKEKKYWVRAIYHNDVKFTDTSPADEKVPFNLKDPLLIDSGILNDIDIVIHLAAIARHHTNLDDLEYHSINVEGVSKLIECCKRSKVTRFIFISSIEAAGPGDGAYPLTEDSPENPINIYGKSKLEAERITLANHTSILSTTVIRLPLIYGPGNYLNVPKLFGAVKLKVFPFIGDGNSKMEFTFVKNAVAGILFLMENERSEGELFFVSEHTRTVKEVVQAVAKAGGQSPIWLHIPVRIAWLIGISFEILSKLFPFKPFVTPLTGKPFFSRNTVYWNTHSTNWCSSDKLYKLGFTPPYTLEEGTKETWDDFKKRAWV